MLTKKLEWSASKILRETFETLSRFERNGKVAGTSKSQFQEDYQKLFKHRLTQNATVLEALIRKEPQSSEDFRREPNEVNVRSTLRSLKFGKPPGKRGFVPELLLALDKELIRLIKKVQNLSGQ